MREKLIESKCSTCESNDFFAILLFSYFLDYRCTQWWFSFRSFDNITPAKIFFCVYIAKLDVIRCILHVVHCCFHYARLGQRSISFAICGKRETESEVKKEREREERERRKGEEKRGGG